MPFRHGNTRSTCARFLYVRTRSVRIFWRRGPKEQASTQPLNVCLAAASVVNSCQPKDKTLQVLSGLERDGVIIRYAIGGAMAATFYAEPVLTFDLESLSFCRARQASCAP
jgi:hypothetical protein